MNYTRMGTFYNRNPRLFPSLPHVYAILYSVRHDLKAAIAKFLIRLRITADVLTYIGLTSSFYAGWLIANGRLLTAGAALLFSGLCDLLDGAVARASGKDSAFGGILDSSLDRYGDGAVLGGALIYCIGFESVLYTVLALSALIGSFSVSYVRARTECETDDGRTGFWERGERLVLIALALLLRNVNAALWILGIGTHWTVLQRLFYAHGQTREKAVKKTAAWVQSGPRSDWPYFLKVAALVLLLIFWRPA